MTEAKPKSGPNWGELPRELTAAILSRADDFDVLRSAQFVCSSWRSVCRDPLRWRTIELRVLRRQSLRSKFDYAFVAALDYSSGQASEITVDGFCSDFILSSITNRQRQIKCLRLHGAANVTEKAICDATEKLPLLEELEISGGSFGSAFISSLGDKCPRLESLMLRCQCDNITPYTPLNPNTEPVFNTQANAIAECLPGLRKLDLVSNCLTDAGLRAILDGCPNLESLDLRSCLFLKMQGDLRKRCREKIKRLLFPEDGVLPIDECSPIRFLGYENYYDDESDEDDDDYDYDDEGDDYDDDDEEEEDGDDEEEDGGNGDDDHDEDEDNENEASITEYESSEGDVGEFEVNEDDEISDGFGEEFSESDEDGISEGDNKSGEDELSEENDDVVEGESGIDSGVGEFSEAGSGDDEDEFSEGNDDDCYDYSDFGDDYSSDDGF